MCTKNIKITTLSFFLATSLNAITLKETVLSVIDSNADVLSEKFNKEAYKKYVDEEKGDYLPTLDLDAFIEESKTTLNRDSQANDPTTAKKDGWNAILRFEQVLYDGGRTPSEVEEFRHSYISNKYRSDRRVEEIVRSAVDSYLNLVKYQELIDISTHSVNVHDDYLVIAQEKEEISGEVLESYQVNSKKHFVIDRLMEQKIDNTNALNTYEQLTNQEISGNICRPIINEKLIPKTLEKTIEETIRTNTKILEVISKVKEQRENYIQSNAANLPNLKFQWQMSWDDDLAEPEDGREDINRVRLILNWNLFEGGKTKIAKQREELFLKEQQKVLDNTIKEVVNEVKTSYKNYYAKKAKIENLKKYVQDNKNIKEVYLKQLEDGTRTFIDILNAESEYFRSQIDSIEEEYELFAIYYDLLMQRNILSDSIINSKIQVCPTFESISVKAKEDKKVNKEKEEKLDSDLIDLLDNGLSEEKEEKKPELNNTNLDEEINNLIFEEIPASYISKDEKSDSLNLEDDLQIEEKNNVLIENSPILQGKYTINIATLKSDEDIQTFLTKMKLDNKNIILYNTNNRTKVLYGNYETSSEALDSLKKFSLELLEKNVYIDTLEKHRKILKKYKTVNK
ncbi:TolC family protein [Arcobacter roscoffensis]|uniref:TolC family protein n=1 Tax=Arcobacter roscoffensis TaxID=2961520 RepID=A0ABY5E6Y6_9BACT|nr:TolC family protein [Arcobacter roscoffensis]UTJ06925.1 TolC family protein [Arcobacter roscoffensis]